MNQIDDEVKDATIMCGQQTAMNAERVAIALMNAAVSAGASIEQLKEALVILAGTVGAVTSMTAEEVALALDCVQPKVKETEPTYTKSFVRPRIVHQVLERKPRHLIKKIIR